MTKKKGPKSISYKMRLREDVVKGVRALAEKENRSFNNALETLLLRALEKK